MLTTVDHVAQFSERDRTPTFWHRHSKAPLLAVTGIVRLGTALRRTEENQSTQNLTSATQGVPWSDIKLGPELTPLKCIL
jgi:hypothetical protein